MSARAIGTATVSFGLVSIPIKLYTPASSDSDISFRQLDAETRGKLKQQYVRQSDGKIVERSQMVKGYEYQKDKFVIFSEEELKSVAAASRQAIEITEFVPLSQVDPVYFEKAYYLGPDKGGARPYRLLAEALRRSGLAGIAQYATRGKEYLVLVRPAPVDPKREDGAWGLVLHQLYYPDEVRAFSEVPLDDVEVKESEVGLALQVIGMNASTRFEPTGYEDSVKKKIERLVEQKISGQEVSLEPAEAPRAEVVDLMAALKASLEAGGLKKAARG